MLNMIKRGTKNGEQTHKYEHETQWTVMLFSYLLFSSVLCGLV